MYKLCIQIHTLLPSRKSPWYSKGHVNKSRGVLIKYQTCEIFSLIIRCVVQTFCNYLETCNTCYWPYVSNLHSKSSRVRFDPEKSQKGPDPFWGQTYPESRSDWPGIRVRLTRNPSQKDILDSDSGNFYPDSRSVWPRNGSGPMGPFSGSNLTREFLECSRFFLKGKMGHITDNIHI